MPGGKLLGSEEVKISYLAKIIGHHPLYEPNVSLLKFHTVSGQINSTKDRTVIQFPKYMFLKTWPLTPQNVTHAGNRT